ncbi:hypothetical protein [Pontibacter pamirensis]|uniref:hypothetical protein n=1 Tax=Pontibacter pamirensis TaxID=2562824 RepID=UPI001F47188E|nr:hypothetical protein [Pontibacter pamirensis]
MPPYIIWAVAAFVVLLLLWLAWQRPNKQRLVWRLLASVVAGVSLVLLVFQPTTQQAISPSTAILLTEGYNVDTLQRLIQRSAAEPQVYTYGTTADDATPIRSLYRLRQEQPGLRKVHLLGYGLKKEELNALEDVQVQLYLSPKSVGMAAIHWPEKVKLGETVAVSGQYNREGEASTWLYLMASGQVRDSVEVTADTTAGFKLRYTPKQAGQFVHHVVENSGEEADTVGQVSVQVQPVQRLGVLLLASSPLFEFRFLKNHLAELQHRVALRTTISKGMSQSEWLNMPRHNLNRLTPKLLQQFDVVITEPQALQNLSAGERATLERAVREEGVGVLTITNAPANSRSTSFFTSFQTRRLSQQDTRSTRASWADNTTAIATAAPYTLVYTTAVAGLVAEQNDQFLAGAKRAGWGKVAMSLVPQTFPWQLEGKEEVYASYWANLLSAVAKQEVQETFWQLASPQVPRPNQPLTLTFTDYAAAGADVPSATVTHMADSSSVDLPLAQHPLQPTQFSGTFWPRRSGWHQVQVSGAAPYSFFVQDSAVWAFTTIQARQQATQDFVAQQNAAPVAEAAVAYNEEPVPLIWFFLLFVLSSGFLWLEEKF